MITFLVLFITLSFFSSTYCSSGSTTSRIFRPKHFPVKYRSAEFSHGLITSRSLTKSTLTAETDQNFTIAISMNTCIGESLERIQKIEHAPHEASSSNTFTIPRLDFSQNIHKVPKLLEKAYRTLGILELVKNKYPENHSVAAQIEITLEYIKKLDPPIHPDGIPESARGSSERKRRWQDLNQSARSHPLPSPLSKGTSILPEKNPIDHLAKKNTGKKPIKKRTKNKKKLKRTFQLSLPLTLLPTKTSVSAEHEPHNDFDITSLLARLDQICTEPSSSDKNIHNFIDSIYQNVHMLNQQFADECSSKINICESSFQEIASCLLPLFSPLAEHYYLELTDEETTKVEQAIYTAYTLYTRIQPHVGYFLISAQTAKDIDTCATIATGIQTPRSERKEEAALHQLFNIFTETLSCIHKKQKIMVQNLPENYKGSTTWHTEHEISEQVIIDTALELLTKLKRNDDLLRLNFCLSRHPSLVENSKIKSLMNKATKKIAEDALKEREQISPRRQKPLNCSR